MWPAQRGDRLDIVGAGRPRGWDRDREGVKGITNNVDFSRWGAMPIEKQMIAAIIYWVAYHSQFVVFEGEGCSFRHELMRSSWWDSEAEDFCV